MDTITKIIIQIQKTGVNAETIKCVDSNINVNGIDISELPQNRTALAAANEAGGGREAANTQNSNGIGDRINLDKNLVNICTIVNLNEEVKDSAPGEDQTWEECFTENLSEQQINSLWSVGQLNTIQDLCDRPAAIPKSDEGTETLFSHLYAVQQVLDEEQTTVILQCLVELRLFSLLLID